MKNNVFFAFARPLAVASFMVFFAAALLSPSGCVFAAGAPEKFKKVTVLPPSADGVADPSLRKALDELRLAVKERDAEKLLSFIAEDIKIGFGAESGRKHFASMWKLGASPKDSKIWNALERILSLGGTYDASNGSYVAPYTFNAPMGGLTGFEYMIVTGSSVNVREKPSSKSAVVRKVDHEVVFAPYDEDEKRVSETVGGEPGEWVRVRLYDGTEGYIFDRYLRGQLDYRLSIEKSGGAWKIVFMVSGD